jgi:cyclic dehypoxanthinyl futalosine synthase
MMNTDSTTLLPLCDKIRAGERISEGEALLLLTQADLLVLGQLAETCRQRFHKSDRATFLIDRNINYTNICVSQCRFCAFYRQASDPQAYCLTTDEIIEKVAEAARLGATQIMLQGGLHPELGIDYFEAVLNETKSRFSICVHSFSPPEIVHLAGVSGLTIKSVLERLQAAGLDSLPGGGAEILVDRVRQQVSPHKASTAQWLEVMETAHALGLRTTATMMIGTLETAAERIEHLMRIRQLQDRTGGFRAFIPWTFVAGNTELGGAETSALDYVRTLAVSRIYLDNIVNIQGSWVTQGREIGQMSLFFGANDLGSIMLEENVVRAAGASNRITEAEMVALIRRAGKLPAQRDTAYQILKTYP